MSTPKLTISLSRPNDVSLEVAMLNTSTEANVMSYTLTRSLGYLILNIDKLKLKTVSRQTV